ncbi:MAG: hypothetical protein ACXVJO_18175 [Thermoanaerobaculia bacterium]
MKFYYPRFVAVGLGTITTPMDAAHAPRTDAKIRGLFVVDRQFIDKPQSHQRIKQDFLVERYSWIS